MSKQAILGLKEKVDIFLDKWTDKMHRAGYLESTTAKRRDCILSYQWFLEPLWERLESGRPGLDFFQLIRNDRAWADKLVQTARRHRFRGVTADMFVGCFKTLVQAVAECILEMDLPSDRKLAALNLIRDYADAYETIMVADWTALTQQEEQDRLDEANRTLTLAKNKSENILAAISDLVLVADENGVILEFNQAAEDFVALTELKGLEDLKGKIVWEVFNLEARDMKELLRYYPVDQSHEISVLNDSIFFELKVVPLKTVSLASSSFLIILTDVTCHVERREALEEMVLKRTEDLEQEKLQLEEMNITLRNVMGNVNKEIEQYKSDLTRTVNKVLLPAMEKIKTAQSPMVQKGYLDILEDQLRSLMVSGRQYDPLLLKLSPTEMKVCRFVQAGNSSKDISEVLNLSLGTIQTHRKNIRKKLKLQNRRISLYTYLVNREY